MVSCLWEQSARYWLSVLVGLKVRVRYVHTHPWEFQQVLVRNFGWERYDVMFLCFQKMSQWTWPLHLLHVGWSNFFNAVLEKFLQGLYYLPMHSCPSPPIFLPIAILLRLFLLPFLVSLSVLCARKPLFFQAIFLDIIVWIQIPN